MMSIVVVVIVAMVVDGSSWHNRVHGICHNTVKRSKKDCLLPSGIEPGSVRSGRVTTELWRSIGDPLYYMVFAEQM